MNLTATYKYQMSECKNTLLIYYLVLVLLQLASITLILSRTHIDYGSINSTEPISIIFVFILGLCTFKEPFLMSIQNGVSRKTFFFSKIASTATTALVISAIDTIVLRTLWGGVFGLMDKLSYRPEMELAFRQDWYTFQLSAVLKAFLFQACLVLLAILVGYCISLMFYRLKKTGKIIAGAGVPILCLIVIPSLDEIYADGFLRNKILDFGNYITGSAVHMTVFSLISSILLLGISYLMLRRAVIKQSSRAE